MKKVILAAVIVMAMLSLYQTWASACSATVYCQCVCDDGVYGAGTTVDVDGDCERFMWWCNGPCLPASNELDDTADLCVDRYKGKCTGLQNRTCHRMGAYDKLNRFGQSNKVF